MEPSRRAFLKAAGAVGVTAPFENVESALGPAQADAGLRQTVQSDQAVIALVGDLFLTRELPDHNEPQAEQVFDVLRKADAAFANLEGGLSTTGNSKLGAYPCGPAIRGHPSLVKELAWMGIDAVSLANNHTGNFGRDALLETLATLDRAGIHHAGAGPNRDAAYGAAHVRARNLTIGFLSLHSYYHICEANDVATATEAGLARCRAYDVVLQLAGGLVNLKAPSYMAELEAGGRQTVMAPVKDDLEQMATAIRQARERADFVILYVHFHWGRHFKADLPYQQRVLAQVAVDAGVDLFVGHGPHVLRGIEVYRGKPIVYSLANFMLQRRDNPSPAATSSPPPPTRQSVVLRATIAKQKTLALEFLPIVMGTDGRPRFARDSVGLEMRHRLAGLSAQFGTELGQKEWFVMLSP